MRRSTGLIRTLARVTAFLQLLLPTAVSIADARLERDAMSARAYSHIEAATGKDCVRLHKADCALCQHLTTPLTRATKSAPAPYAVGCELPRVAFALPRARDWSERPSLPRAPPTA